MPKFIENYEILSIQKRNSVGIEYLKGKQKGTGKYFILKRLAIKQTFNSVQNIQTELKNNTNAQYQKLIHQSKILKTLQHEKIPKCIRILKTANNIYFIYEQYPTMTLKEYLRKYSLKFSQKKQISLMIIQTLSYIHLNNVAFRGINSLNISIDKEGRIYFINFTQALSQQQESKDINTNDNLKNERKKKIFQILILNDVQDCAKLLFEIFSFNTFNSKLSVFTNRTQKNLYQSLLQVITNNAEITSLNKIKIILKQKFSIQQTQCTQYSQSPSSPRLKNSFSKIIQRSSKERLTKNSPLEVRRSYSCSRQMLINSRNSTTLMKKTQNIQNSVKFQPLDSNKTTNQISLFFKTVERNKQIESIQNNIEKIINLRKQINFLLSCSHFINKVKDNKLLISIFLKIENLVQKILKQIMSTQLNFKSQNSSIKIKEYLKIIKDESHATNTLIFEMKQFLKNEKQNNPNANILYFIQMQKHFKNNESSIIEQKISFLTFNFLQNIINKNITSYTTQQTQKTSSFFNSPSDRKNAYDIQNFHKTNPTFHTPQNKKKYQLIRQSHNTIDHNHLKSMNYEEVKLCYYLSIKLKYGTFEKFFDKKILKTLKKLNVFEDQYFQMFETKTIPVNSLIQEIVLRLQKFFKKSTLIKTV